MPIKVEVCASSFAEAKAADDLGCDSVELCTWLSCGGVTPSNGMVDTIRSSIGSPVRVLIRPTPNGFTYAPPEANMLLVDCEVFGGGAMDLVTGALIVDGQMDVRLMQAVQLAAPESAITFHRAIDHASDPMHIVEQCLELGIQRILTSGGADTAMLGMAMLKRIVQQAGDQCAIAIGAGIGPLNVVELVERTGAQEVHFSAQRRAGARATGPSLSSHGSAADQLMEPDVAKIEGVLNALVKAGLR